jgi:hypothetical protein
LPPHFDIAHESLIRTWPLLQEWLQEEPRILRQQRMLEVAAQEWHRQNCGDRSGYFLSPDRLAAAKSLQTNYPDSMSIQVLRYLQAWERYCRRCTRKRQLMRLLVPVSLAAGMVVTYGYNLIRSAQLSWPVNQPIAVVHPTPSNSLSPGPEHPSPTPERLPVAIAPLAPRLKILPSPFFTTVKTPQPLHGQTHQDIVALGHLDKVAEWADPNRPNSLIQVWCGRSHPQPLCLTLSTGKLGQVPALVQP